MKKLTVIAPTVAKLKPLDSKVLTEFEKLNISVGQEFEIIETTSGPGSHVGIKLKTPLKFGKTEHFACYFYSNHIRLSGDNPSQKQIVIDDFPYRSQTDNWYNPTGSCNVTSIAMCLEYFGAQRKTDIPQLEDELYASMESLGLSRHSPTDLAEMVVRYKTQDGVRLKDKFIANATIEGVKRHLADGNPCVTHGYFTAFGHIIVITGYDDKGLIVHDPYGEWFSTGYDRNDERNNTKGKYLHYSYELIRKTCMPDGDFWVHFISK